MGRWAALLILGLSLAPLLRADGDSGTLLATPQRYKDGQLIPNATSATIRLGSESDPLVGKRDGWAALGGDFCYARATGVGLRGDGKSVLYRPFDPPETISYVSVVCGVESKSALGKPLALALSLGTREVKTQEFTIENPGETRTVTFAFTPIEAPDIRLTNESDTVFEVQRVSWFADAPPITVEVDITPAPAGGTIRCSVASCTGGSGTYTRVRWTFNGNTSSAVDHIQSMATFTAPDREGTYPLTLEIADDQGNSRTFSYSVIVGADATVAYPIVSNVTRTGFTLSWDRPASGFSPEAFAVRVFRSDLLNVTLTPEWSPAGDGWNSPEFSLDDALDGLDAQNVAVTVPKDWQGDLKYYVGNGSWTPLLRVDDTFLSFALSPGQPFRFRVEKAKPPATLELNAGLSHTYEEEKIPLEGQKLTRTFTDLPAGKTVKVSITAHGRKDDGTLTYYNSPELSVPLLPIPVPSAIFDSSGRIRFKWDSLALAPDENPTISLRLFAETPPPRPLPHPRPPHPKQSRQSHRPHQHLRLPHPPRWQNLHPHLRRKRLGLLRQRRQQQECPHPRRPRPWRPRHRRQPIPPRRPPRRRRLCHRQRHPLLERRRPRHPPAQRHPHQQAHTRHGRRRPPPRRQPHRRHLHPRRPGRPQD